MSINEEFVSKFRQEIYNTLDGQFYMSNGDKITYNPCSDPRFKGYFYACILKPNGAKKTIIWDPSSGSKIADT